MFCIYHLWYTSTCSLKWSECGRFVCAVQSVTSPGPCHCSNCIWVNQSIITSDKGRRGAGGVSPAYGSQWESIYLLIRFLCVPLSFITESAISGFPLTEYISASKNIHEQILAITTALRWALRIIILKRDVNFYTQGNVWALCLWGFVSAWRLEKSSTSSLLLSLSLYNCVASLSLARRQAWWFYHLIRQSTKSVRPAFSLSVSL